MSAVNANWHRWTYASVSDHLHTAATAGGLELVVEFTDERGPDWKTAETKAEATISGPITREMRSGHHSAQVNVFIVVTSHRSASGDYGHIDHVGTMANALDQCIRVMDYGATNLLEIGQLTPDGEINTVHIKPTETDDQIFSTIQAQLSGIFTE
jgi:hypothetical protein